MVLIFSTPCSSLRASKRTTMLLKSSTVGSGAEPARERDETRDVREQDRGLGEAVGDGIGGLGLEPLDDAVGQDVSQEGIGLGLGGLGRARKA